MPDVPDHSGYSSRYNLGCGTNFYKGYLNVGYWTDLEHDKVYTVDVGEEKRLLCNFDLRLGIPAGDETLDVVYHSHFLEHLSYTEGLEFIDECHRTLKPGGLMRVLVPDLELWARNYIGGADFFFDQYRRHVLGDDREKYPTNASVFMGALHNHEHKMGYDFATLNAILEAAGFADIRRTFYQESILPEITDMEIYDLEHSVRCAESLCLECRKPL